MAWDFDEALAPASSAEQELIDPDPFMIGIAIFAALAAGAGFLETRRARQFMERQQREQFRTAWFAARRTLIHFERAVDEFETYILEDNYGDQGFRIGRVRLRVDVSRHQAMRRLKGQALTTANFMSDTLDDLSSFLGSDYQEEVDAILARLNEASLPDSYAELISFAREVKALYSNLILSVGEREGFTHG